MSRPPKARKISVFLAFSRFSSAVCFGKKLLTTDLTTYGKTAKIEYFFLSGCGAVGSARRLGRRCRRFESCHSDQKSAENEAFCPTFGCFFAYNRLLSTTSENSPDSRKAACASFTAQSTLFFRKAFSLTTAPQFLRADRHELYINRVWLQTPRNLTIWGVSRFLAFLQS